MKRGSEKAEGGLDIPLGCFQVTNGPLCKALYEKGKHIVL